MAIKRKTNEPEGFPSSGFVKVLLLKPYLRHRVGTLITVTAHEARTLVAEGKAEVPQVEFKG